MESWSYTGRARYPSRACTTQLLILPTASVLHCSKTCRNEDPLASRQREGLTCHSNFANNRKEMAPQENFLIQVQHWLTLEGSSFLPDPFPRAQKSFSLEKREEPRAQTCKGKSLRPENIWKWCQDALLECSLHFSHSCTQRTLGPDKCCSPTKCLIRWFMN